MYHTYISICELQRNYGTSDWRMGKNLGNLPLHKEGGDCLVDFTFRTARWVRPMG